MSGSDPNRFSLYLVKRDRAGTEISREALGSYGTRTALHRAMSRYDAPRYDRMRLGAAHAHYDVKERP